MRAKLKCNAGSQIATHDRNLPATLGFAIPDATVALDDIVDPEIAAYVALGAPMKCL